MNSPSVGKLSPHLSHLNSTNCLTKDFPYHAAIYRTVEPLDLVSNCRSCTNCRIHRGAGSSDSCLFGDVCCVWGYSNSNLGPAEVLAKVAHRTLILCVRAPCYPHTLLDSKIHFRPGWWLPGQSEYSAENSDQAYSETWHRTAEYAQDPED